MLTGVFIRLDVLHANLAGFDRICVEETIAAVLPVFTWAERTWAFAKLNTLHNIDNMNDVTVYSLYSLFKSLLCYLALFNSHGRSAFRFA